MPVDAPGPIAVNENRQSGAGNSTAIRRDNRGFIECLPPLPVIEESDDDNTRSREQKSVCVILYGEHSSSLFPTIDQESSPGMQMDRR